MTSRFGPFELDEQHWELRKNGRLVPVQRKALETILFLVRNRTRVVARGELRASLWPGTAVSDAAVAHAIMQARRALGDDRRRWIQSVRGRGVRFVGTVEEAAALPEHPAAESVRPDITSFERQVLQCFHVLVGAVVEIARTVSPILMKPDDLPTPAGGENALWDLAHRLRRARDFEAVRHTLEYLLERFPGSPLAAQVPGALTQGSPLTAEPERGDS
jgi:DNA-binding winged helix-turn-helix (wHTH) protein